MVDFKEIFFWLTQAVHLLYECRLVMPLLQPILEQGKKKIEFPNHCNLRQITMATS